MRALGKVNRNAQLARRHRQAAHVVGVLMRNQNRVQRLRLLARQLHAPEQLAAAQPRIHQNPRTAARDDRRVPLGPRSQHREPDHPLSIARLPVDRTPPRVAENESRGLFYPFASGNAISS